MIRIVDYDDSWPAQFEAEAACLAQVLGGLALRIEHVGSTSVPGLAAKAVIDIQISVAALDERAAIAAPLARLGYVHVPLGDFDAVYPFFQKPADWPCTHHIHLCVAGSEEERRHLAFRDRLRRDPVLAAHYAELKCRLAATHRGDTLASRERYSLSKSDFIAAAMDAAAVQADNPPQETEMDTRDMELVWPSVEHLPSYVAALERGWSADNVRGELAAREELAQIAADASAFLAGLVDRDGKGPPVTLPDGSVVPRLPGYRRWLWDGEFCGSIGLRWRPGTSALPPHCLGHIGYAVVPWKQRRGYATRALRTMLAHALAEGLAFVDITTDPDNAASQRVIEANGGVLVERFVKPAQFGSAPGLRYRIALR